MLNCVLMKYCNLYRAFLVWNRVWVDMCERIQNGKEMWDLNNSVEFFFLLESISHLYSRMCMWGVLCVHTHTHIHMHRVVVNYLVKGYTKARVKHKYTRKISDTLKYIACIWTQTFAHIHSRPSRREMEKVLAEVIFWCVVPWSTMSIDRQAYNVCHLAENGRLFGLLLIHAVIADADFVWSLFSLQPSLPPLPLPTAWDVWTTTDRTHSLTHTYKRNLHIQKYAHISAHEHTFAGA